MKDSGVKWIGEIPEYWKYTRIDTLFTEGVQKNIFYEFDHALKFTYGALVPKNEEGNVTELKGTYLAYSIIEEDDIAINGLNLNFDFVSQRVARSPERGILTSAYLILKPKNRLYSRYFTYQLKSWDNQKVFHGMGKGVRLTLSFAEVKKMLMPVPPLKEQLAIADYLDKKTSEIDAAIKEAQELIEKYKAYKQSIITEIVTKGLNPNVTMKDSGVEWIGEIPEHWGCHPVYVYFDERKNSNYRMQEQNLLSLSYGKIIRKDINTNGGLLPVSFTTYNIVEDGDIIIRPTDLQNDKKSLRTGLVKERGIITSAYIALKSKFSQSSRYYHYMLHTADVCKVFYNMGNGVRQGLNYSEFSKLMMISPSVSEQEAIADYLDDKCMQIDSVISDKENLISKLQEYKKSIIFEYVTGKKEVPNG